jgi:hypothetical protein
MATSSEKDKIMKLSQAEYTTLSTTGTLTKDGVTYTYSPTDTIYVTPDANSPLVFTNVSATFTANSDADYSDYSYKAVLTCQGVTASMLATVIFSEEQATSGNYALTCVTGADSVTIYSNDDTSITVPSIIAGSPVEVEAEYNAKHNYSTDEQVVGTWIDGKPIYEKTLHYVSQTEVTTSGEIVVSNDIDKIVSVDGIIKLGSLAGGNWASCSFYESGSFNAMIKTLANLVTFVSNGWKLTEGYAVLQYTKTTD